MTEVASFLKENKATCGVEGCGRPAETRGWCQMHYVRWKKTGDPGGPTGMRSGTIADRFWAKVDKGDGCWLWLGAKTKPNGYGRFYSGSPNGVLAHRWSYEQAVGPVPDGMQLDHLCRTKTCVRPDHLEPVDNAENQRRIPTFRCGHPKDEAHSYVRPSTGDKRECLVCLRERNNRNQRRRRSA